LTSIQFVPSYTLNTLLKPDELLLSTHKSPFIGVGTVGALVEVIISTPVFDMVPLLSTTLTLPCPKAKQDTNIIRVSLGLKRDKNENIFIKSIYFNKNYCTNLYTVLL
jgi:hypothetical protein